MSTAIDYLNPNLPAGLRRVRMPVVEATPETLAGYGTLVDNPDDVRIEIVRWPAGDWRPVDPDTGDEGGTTEGVFISQWKGDILFGRNEAVDGHYILAYGVEPAEADSGHDRPAERIFELAPSSEGDADDRSAGEPDAPTDVQLARAVEVLKSWAYFDDLRRLREGSVAAAEIDEP